MEKTGKVTYLDLFAGAGGLSEGFRSQGYQPVAHVEMDRDACDTLKTRECFYYLSESANRKIYDNYLKRRITRDELYQSVPDILLDSVICETMSDETLPSIFTSIDHGMTLRGIKKIDLIIGGPPCQAYSMVGRSRKDMKGDPRNTLYKLYFKVLERYQPKMFVFENVPGLATAEDGRYLKNIITGFKKRGYDLEQRILNASDYLVLQQRKRIILIGWKRESDCFYPDLLPKKHSFKVGDMLADLPPLEPGERKNQYAKPPRKYLRETGIRQKGDVLTWHEARRNRELDREIYRVAIRAWKNGHKRLKYTDLPESLLTHHNRESFLDRFKVVADDIPVAQTMVAHIAKDGHYYIHPSLKQARSLSVREAARIQSFPDNYYFEGPRTSVFKQIGNAVPPLMAGAIAKALSEQI